MNSNLDTDIRLIAIDVDGTLLDSRHTITPRVEAALNAARARGVQIVIATGRPRQTTLPLIEQLKLTTPGVFMQGLNVCNADGTLRHNLYMEADAAEIVLRYAVQRDLTVMVYNVDQIATRHLNAYTDTLRKYHEPRAEALGDSIVDMPRRVPISKMMFIDDPARIPDIRRELEGRVESRVALLTSLPQFLEVLPFGASKGAGLAWLLKDIGIAPEHVMSIGDGENDLEMIQLAGIGVAMANGNPHLKAVADFVTTSNDEDGVAVAIERFVLNQPARAE